MRAARRCPSDLSDARWKLIEPTLAAWPEQRRAAVLDFGVHPNMTCVP
ncbi:hypothetical protein [Actinomadura gamaensis]|uniref:Transposase n=1 Tax=Actinomadura gamaensis TaxID=1763541 RepID=A0ABV9U0Q0_9ACTN